MSKTRLLLVLTVYFFTRDLAAAARSDQCASPCDVSRCPSASCPGGHVPDRCNCCPACSSREGDPCGRKHDLPCGDGLECRPPAAGRRRGSRRVCRCRMEHKVCGSDGRTYGSPCKMTAASRKAQRMGGAAVVQAHRGACALSRAGASPARHGSPRYKFNFIADVVEKIAPAVVHIELFVRHPLFARHMRLSSGSGFIVTHSGVIVTNAHVVTAAAAVTGRPQLRVRLHDGEGHGAVVRDVDRKADIATIKINPQKRLPVLSLGRSADLRPGEFVVAIGSPFALQNTVTTGIVSTAQRDGKELGIKDSDMDYVQTDAIINYGNSGGPLVNLDGEVIGINTLKVTAGIAFAIPSDRISRFLADARAERGKGKTGAPEGAAEEPQSDPEVSGGERRRLLGIAMLTVTQALAAELQHQHPGFSGASRGVLVQRVLPNTPAESGGVRAGDVIVKANGRTVETTADVHAALRGERPLLLEVHRGSDDLLLYVQPQVPAHASLN